MSTPFEREDVEQAAMAAQFETNASYVAPPEPAPQGGKIHLTPVQLEAFRGLELAQADLRRRQREVYAEILGDVSRPDRDAELVRLDIEAGIVTWKVTETVS